MILWRCKRTTRSKRKLTLEVDKVLFELTMVNLARQVPLATELPVIGLSLLYSVQAHICDRQHKTHLTSVKETAQA